MCYKFKNLCKLPLQLMLTLLSLKFWLHLWLGWALVNLNIAQRPFYNIAHMVNSIGDIKYYLDQGANAIEADVSFSDNGTALSTYHGYPCDCFRICTKSQNIQEYFEYIGFITNPASSYYDSRLVLLMLDLKLSQLNQEQKYIAGQDIAYKIIRNIFKSGQNKARLNLLLCINRVHDYPFVIGFIKQLSKSGLHYLRNKIGWDVGMNDNINEISLMWNQFDVVNVWQGDGISNCVNSFRNLNRLLNAISFRDNDVHNGVIKKVYRWTVDLKPFIRESLSVGVDAIITNRCDRLSNILKENNFRGKYRLANFRDNPWKRVQQL